MHILYVSFLTCHFFLVVKKPFLMSCFHTHIASPMYTFNECTSILQTRQGENLDRVIMQFCMLEPLAQVESQNHRFGNSISQTFIFLCYKGHFIYTYLPKDWANSFSLLERPDGR